MATKKKTTKKETFAQQFEQLENIVESLEGDELDVDASITKFEEGLKIASTLKKNLEKTENKIEELKKKYE